MSALELAERAVAAARDDALALVVHERSLMLRFADGRPTQATAVDDFGVELAVVRDGHVGRAGTNDGDEEALVACARRAEAAAEAAAAVSRPGPHPGFGAIAAAAGSGASVASDRSNGGYEGNEGEPASARPLGGHDAVTAELDPAVGGAALGAVFAVAERHGLAPHGIWSAAEEERAVATSAGRALLDRTTDAFMKVICIAPGGRSGYASQTAVAVGAVEPELLAERAAAKAVVRGEAAELPPGEYPVVMEPQAVGWLLDLLGSTALNGLAQAEGRGALAGRLGQTVAAPGINLADSPRSAATLPRAFDAEGTPKRPMPLIQDGVARAVVHDRRSAALAGTESTGHALAPGGHPQGPGPVNLVLAGGGAASLEELCAPLERGVYVTRLWYANVVRPKETLITAVTRDGTFLIEDGRVTRPLRDLRLTDSVLGILSRVGALTAGQELTSDGEFYGRRFASGVVCPGLRASAARFTGAAG
jgi:predicted Zn-dependent protease